MHKEAASTAKHAQPKTLLEAARWNAGFPGPDGLKRLAKRLRRSAVYVRRIELHGDASPHFAKEAARLLGCHPLLFFAPNYAPAADGLKSAPARPPATDSPGNGPADVPEATPATNGPWKAGRIGNIAKETARNIPDTGGVGDTPYPKPNARRLLAQEAADLALRSGFAREVGPDVRTHPCGHDLRREEAPAL